MSYAERGRVCVTCVAIRAAVNGLNGQCVDYSWCGGGTGLASDIFKEFGGKRSEIVSGKFRKCDEMLTGRRPMGALPLRGPVYSHFR